MHCCGCRLSMVDGASPGPGADAPLVKLDGCKSTDLAVPRRAGVEIGGRARQAQRARVSL